MPLREFFVVDDSAVMRQLLTTLLEADPEIEVIGTAPDPLIARDKIKALNPDVVTPTLKCRHRMAVSFLRRIAARRPMPVVMISTLTPEPARKLRSKRLEIGAGRFHRQADQPWR